MGIYYIILLRPVRKRAPDGISKKENQKEPERPLVKTKVVVFVVLVWRIYVRRFCLGL